MTVPQYYLDNLKNQLKRSKLTLSDRVWEAFKNVPREYFVGNNRNEAYKDRPLPIGRGQTISAPHMYAMMLSEEVSRPRKGMDVVEIGTGSGYGAALLAYTVKPGKVISIERHQRLVEFARDNVKKLDLDNLEIRLGDGTTGVRSGKYDRIIITAAGPKIPSELFDQMKSDGIMIMPLELDGRQWLSRIMKENGEPIVEKLFAVRFVPLIGEEGFDE